MVSLFWHNVTTPCMFFVFRMDNIFAAQSVFHEQHANLEVVEINALSVIVLTLE